MSSYERTAVQAVIGQKLDGQFQKILSEYERPIQPKFFSLKQQCAKAEKINPELSNANDTPAAQCDDMEYTFSCAAQEIEDKAHIHAMSKKSLNAAQLRHGYVASKKAVSAFQGVLVLLCTVFAESFINAAFFNNAHMVAGPAAAIITSFLISLTNVVVCACAGFFIGRYLNYGANAQDSEDSHFRNTRIRSKILFVCFIALITFFHITVGLVRSQESIEIVLHSPIHYFNMLRTPEAVFLILMGVCMSVIAYHKGIYSFDCPYPEIGRLQRNEEAAQQELQDTLEYYQEEIAAYFDDAEKSLFKPHQLKKSKVDKYNQAVAACHNAKRKLERAVRDAETKCRGKIAELVTSYSCISGEEQSIPIEKLNQMVSFEKYLNVELPSFQPEPEITALKSNLLLEKNQAIKRLTSLFERSIHDTGDKP